MTTLVTGATSGLGRNAAAFLAQKGSTVRTTAGPNAGFSQSSSGIDKNTGPAGG